jgi:transcriptional regulator of arginine metabolism
VSGERRQRQLKILELISTRAIRTQEELAEALAAEGWDVTQSSVSRDIAALKLVKVDGAYTRPARVLATPRSPDDQRIAEGVLTAEPAGDVLVVVHTAPGEASRVGAALDRSAWPEVLGTIAGDDTIFIAARNVAGQRAVLRKLRAVAVLG